MSDAPHAVPHAVPHTTPNPETATAADVYSGGVPDARQPEAETATPIAPWWHTLCVLFLLSAWALLSAGRHRDYQAMAHPLTYLSQMMLSWMLFGTVIAGVLDRGAFFGRTIGRSARLWRGDALRGLLVYAGIYGATVAVAMVGVAGYGAWKLLHHAPPSVSGPARSGDTPAAPVPPPPTANPDPLAQFRSLHFDTKTVFALAPQNFGEWLLWLLVSITAGFTEEHIFRGYLLMQARAYTRRWGMGPRWSTVLSVAAVSLLFGSLHVYEGVGGALLITFLGAVYATVAIQLRNLRAVVVAHFLQDAIAGTMLFFLHSVFSRILPA